MIELGQTMLEMIGMRLLIGVCLVLCGTLAIPLGAQDASLRQDPPVADSNRVPQWLQSGEFSWKCSPPLVQVDANLLPASPEHPWLAIKDPSIVRYQDRWHLFCSLRKQKTGDGRIRIGYTSFDDWQQAKLARWSVLELTPGYHGAPQVFYFEPNQMWYLIYQAEDKTRGLKFGPCYSTNSDISDPSAWTLPQPLYKVPEGQKAGLDFWVICDDQHAFLFFTTLNGQMWQSRTSLDQFPDQGWSEPKVVLQADIYEASHTYKLAGIDRYLTLVEAQEGRTRRYYKAFVANSLEGEWTPLAASLERPFASLANVTPPAEAWSDSYSHGELIRSGNNQRLEVDPVRLRFLIQGASSEEYHVGDYGSIPWKLGILEQQSD